MKLDTEQRQTHILTQRMRQSLAVLQMSAPDLEAFIREEALGNPLLELEPPAGAGRDEPGETSARLAEPEWLGGADGSGSFCYDARSAAEPFETPLCERGGDTLEQALLFQIPCLRLPAALERALRRLIASLDGSGYLPVPTEQLAKNAADKRELDAALEILHTLEPAGAGASCLRECLLIQARRQSTPSPVLIGLIENHLGDIAKNRLSKAASALGVSNGEIMAARSRLLALSPRPGNGYSGRSAVPYIRPDLTVVRVKDSFEVIYCGCGQPTAEINPHYRAMLEHDDPDVRAYVRERLDRAELLIQSIGRRKKTLLECAKIILSAQRRFFELGAGHLAPMSMAAAAAELGVHLSTVSRAVSGKYLQCQWGVYSLSHFFSRGVSRGSSSTSQEGAIARLRRVIEGESPSRPFSDKEIADLLGGLGVSISRRTVAKYREMAGIPPAGGRKRG